jgi:hypothetical protein
MQNNTKPQIMFAAGWLTIILVTWLIMSSRAEAGEIELQSVGNDKWVLRWAE